MIDTLTTARNLEKHGFAKDQAEGLADAMRDTSTTKADFVAIDGRINTMVWMIGVNLTLTLLILGKLFLR